MTRNDDPQPKKGRFSRNNLSFGRIDARKVFIVSAIIFIVLSSLTILSAMLFFNFKIVRLRFGSGFTNEGGDIDLDGDMQVEYIKIEYEIEDSEGINTKMYEFDDLNFTDLHQEFSGKVVVSPSVEEVDITMKLSNSTDEFTIKAKNVDLPYQSTSITLNEIKKEEEFVYDTVEIPMWLELIASLNPAEPIE